MSFLNTILDTVIPAAHADTGSAVSTAAPAGANNLSFIVMIVVFIGFMYFAMWRPQSKRAKEHRNLINALTKGDEVLTTGGILGRISKLVDTYVVLSIADNTEIVIQKSAIANALPKGTLKSIS